MKTSDAQGHRLHRVLDELRAVLGPAAVLTDPDITAGYLRDWTGRFGTAAGVVVRPADTAEVVAVLRMCASAGVAVVPQGGNTGLVGGGVPRDAEIVLSLQRLNGPPVVDQVSGQVTAGAGVTIAAVQAAAAAHGLAYGVDLASRDSATVGGTIATNAGGLRVFRHGDTRAQVIGVEAVLSDGTVVSHLNGLTRDNTGYHLPSLLTGSEGTLAVVTAARLRLIGAPGPTTVALVGLGDVPAAVAVAAVLRPRPEATAVELFLATGLELVMEVTGAAAPLPGRHGAYLLVEAAVTEDVLAAQLSELPGVRDAVLAQDVRGRADLWAYRERHAESIATLGPVHKLDVTLPAVAAADFIARVPGEVTDRCATAQVWIFGHIADGNVHLNVTGFVSDSDDLQDTVYRSVARVGGSISSEHGVGVAKSRWLELNRSPAEIAVFGRIKAALDPAGILNPGVLLP